MRNLENWLTGLVLAAVALLLPLAAFEPVSRTSATVAVVAAGACDDGSAHLVMGCASILL